MVQPLDLLSAPFRRLFSRSIGRACQVSLHQWWTVNLDLLWIDELIKYSSILREEVIKSAAEADDITEDATLTGSDWIEWLKRRIGGDKKGHLAKEFHRWKDMQTMCFGTADGELEDEKMFIIHILLVIMAACYASVHRTANASCLLQVTFSSLFGCVGSVIVYNYSNSVMLDNVRKMNCIEVMEWASRLKNRSYSLHFELALPQNMLIWTTLIAIIHSHANDFRFLTSGLCLLAVLNFTVSLILIYPYLKMPDLVEARSGRKPEEPTV